MNVTIKTPFGELGFDMAQEHALALIQQAVNYAMEPAQGTKPVEPAPVQLPRVEQRDAAMAAAVDQAAPKVEKPANPAPWSRAEALFGDRKAWDMPAAETPTERPVGSDKAESREGVKGFIFAKCEECGKEKGFFSKYPLSYHRCECGHCTPMEIVKPAYVNCKCGETFKYTTNIQAEQFFIPCKACDAPVDLEIGAKGTAYVTVGEKNFRGGRA